MKRLHGNATICSRNISHINIEDNGIIKNLDLNFASKNVILGKSGSGKTTILKSIYKKIEDLNVENNGGLIVIDDAIGSLDGASRKHFLDILVNLNMQVIVTANIQDEKYFERFKKIKI